MLKCKTWNLQPDSSSYELLTNEPGLIQTRLVTAHHVLRIPNSEWSRILWLVENSGSVIRENIWWAAK